MPAWAKGMFDAHDEAIINLEHIFRALSWLSCTMISLQAYFWIIECMQPGWLTVGNKLVFACPSQCPTTGLSIYIIQTASVNVFYIGTSHAPVGAWVLVSWQFVNLLQVVEWLSNVAWVYIIVMIMTTTTMRIHSKLCLCTIQLGPD